MMTLQSLLDSEGKKRERLEADFEKTNEEFVSYKTSTKSSLSELKEKV
jgi:hypothetical protein